MASQTETVSRNTALEWDAVSGCETTCLDIFLRPLLQGIDRLIHVEQVSRDADDEECRQITETEDFAANQDGCEQRIGGAAKDGCVAQRGAKRDGHAELSLVMATSG